MFWISNDPQRCSKAARVVLARSILEQLIAQTADLSYDNLHALPKKRIDFGAMRPRDNPLH
jgi:hypothetical protein